MTQSNIRRRESLVKREKAELIASRYYSGITALTRKERLCCVLVFATVSILILHGFQLKYERGWMLRGLSVVSLVLIYLSTVFLKQHVIADMISSTGLGIILYVLFYRQNFATFRATLRVFYR